MYVLAEGWDGGELADEVEVGSGERVNSTAVINWDGLVSGQSQVLHRKQGDIRDCGTPEELLNKFTIMSLRSSLGFMHPLHHLVLFYVNKPLKCLSV